MRNLISLLFSVFLIGSVTAQVEQKEMTMSLGNQVAFVIDLDGADKKMAEKVWKDYLDDYGKVKKNKKADEFLCEECKIETISNSVMQVFLVLEERKGMTVANAFFDNGSGFINSDSDPKTSNIIEKFIYDYSLEVKKTAIREELEDEEKSLKDFNKDLEKLEKKNEDLHNDIEGYKKKIMEAESDIEKNLKAQDEKRFEIDGQTKKVQEVTERLNNVGKG